MARSGLHAAIALVLVVVAGVASGEEKKASLFRGSDGGFDVSGFLATRGGFLPVPIFITEPAIGYGGGLGAIVFRGGNPLSKLPADTTRRPVPPSMFAGAAFATENGSNGGAAAYFGVFREDRIRYIGVVGAASLNLDYWGRPSEPVDEPLSFGVDGALTIHRLLFRVGNSPFMVGGEWSMSTQDARFDLEELPADAPPREIEQQDSGLGVVGEYETLDSLFTASSGMKARVVAKIYSESLGGDNDRQGLDLEAFGYAPVHERLILGWRGGASFSDGDTPFYLLPYVQMRGLPALKYAGKHIVLGEGEARWRVRGRWSAVAFGGGGYVRDAGPGESESTTVGAAGAGVRYLVAERLGIHAGIDYGRGPDDNAIYLIIGSAWR